MKISLNKSKYLHKIRGPLVHPFACLTTCENFNNFRFSVLVACYKEDWEGEVYY